MLVLNAIELDIHSAEIDGVPATAELDASTERLTLSSNEELDIGSHQVTITFTGTINDKLRGFYRSSFTDDAGNEHVIGTTQMQSTDCRRAFPCWDEPDFKAAFGITLNVRPTDTAVSNSPEIERHDLENGLVAVTFADTMVMSTYLVAFVVGPLEATEWRDVNGIPLRLVHVPGKGHLTAFGLEVAEFCLAWFQEYYGIAYPGDKVELLALPDFAAGAMENLGCITFRENLLLVDPQTSTQPERQLVADVVAHELAHMWFGDLVTMRWWNGIWLNEAFATFMEIAACDAFKPEWGRWLTFGIERTVAFETDSLATTRSVEFEVNSPTDAEGMFDVLTYQKGGALLRMLEQHLGEDRFREGVRHYLRTHAYGNTETSDLWDALEATSGEPVRNTMDSWIWQPGYPVVSVSLVEDELVLQQRKFSFSDGTDDTTWMIPLSYRTSTGTSTVLLEDREHRVAVDTDGPIIVNAGGHSFVRVEYDNDLRSRITQDVLPTLDVLERYTLIDDAIAAVTSCRLEAADFLDMVSEFRNEDGLSVWQSITAGLRLVSRIIGTADERAIFERMVRELCEPTLQRLGEPEIGENDLTGSLRGLLLRTIALLGNDEPSIERCRQILNESATTAVNPELLSAATTVVASCGGASDYERFLEGFRTSQTPQGQLRNLYALAEFRDASLIARTCELALSHEVRTQNAPFLLRACIANENYGSAAWRFVAEHWDEANDRFPTNTIVRMVDSVKLLTDNDDVEMVQQFFVDHPIPQAVATLNQILERQLINAKATETQRPSLIASLQR
jgi:puromycin-sensitive aminopeptidase